MIDNSKIKNNAPAFWPWGVFLFIALIALDQFLKIQSQTVFKNSVFAFSLPLPLWLIYIVYILVLVVMLYYVAKKHQFFSFVTKIAWVFIFAGALSNIGERIILGYVRDFIYIHFSNWVGIYNLADFLIIAGIIVLIFFSSPKE